MKKIISGKVREVYDLEDGRMVIVTTDRISAFDVILPTMITDKGKVLNALSNFWFKYTGDIVKNHMISSDIKGFTNSGKCRVSIAFLIFSSYLLLSFTSARVMQIEGTTGSPAFFHSIFVVSLSIVEEEESTPHPTKGMSAISNSP